MKFFMMESIALLALTVSSAQVEGQQALRQQQVSPKYGFLEKDEWCITAPNVDYDFAILEFKPCDAVKRPKNQLWSLDANGKIHSALDYDKCMVVDHGTDIYDGVLIKIAQCDLRTSLNRFTHSGGSSKLQVLVNGAFCVTNHDAHDTIHAKPCQETSAHAFLYRP